MQLRPGVTGIHAQPLWQALALCLIAGSARATTLYTLAIQPIQVCLDDGTQCANPTQDLYEAAGDKIWGQAGIDLAFLPFITVNDTGLWNFDSATDMPGPFDLLTVIRLFFVPVIHGALGTFGIAHVGGNGVVVSDDIFDIGRFDTIAHELGHNLGLEHTSACTPTSLMASGSCRSVPIGLGDITPDGLALDRLSAAEIIAAVQTGLVRN